jgi:hypothetical protein
MTATTATATAPITDTLDVPGATLTYDVRRNDASVDPVLLLIGSPMGAGGFGTLAGHFPDHTIVTYDPRGVERSVKTDTASESTPAQHELVARHPDDVRILVAHEPPTASVLPDRDAALAAARAVADTYQRKGFGAGLAHFIVLTSQKGQFTAEFAALPGPDPAMFGMPATDDGSRNDPLLAQNMLTAAQYEPDFDALRSASTRIVIGVGVESEGLMARRAGEAIAERLGTALVIFPSGHGGFLGGEYGQAGDPDGFAAKLREVLAANS